MADNTPKKPDEVARQLGRHLDSLRAAGVEWLPGSTDLEPPPAAPPPPPASTDVPTAPAIAPEPLSLPVVAPMLFDAAASNFEQTAAGLTVEQRTQELAALADRVAGCTRCPQLASTRTQTVFGVGPLDPELCFIGEAPGATEDARGEPFVGEAGQLLTRIIVGCGLRREEVFICNILRCRPPGNRLPNAEEAGHCREYLERTLELVQPRFICALGACASQNLLGTTLSIGRLRGRFQEYRGIPVLCTYHPAFLLRSPEKKRDVWEDMKKLLARMGRQVPQK
jgi:uracil-DNA glycosylase